MSRYIGPVFKKSRRLGFSILESGKELARRPYKPGQHGQARTRKPSNYNLQLTEKQKVRFMYGVNERQFKNTFNDSAKMQGIQGENFLKLLESRLDNLVYRLGFAKTRKGARQLVNHGHITVDGRKMNIPSYRVTPGTIIGIREQSKDHPAILASLESINKRVEFVTFNEKDLNGTYVRLPERNELNADIDESLIVEFYNK